MALPSSGQLTFAALQTEFGGSNPISMSEYYRGALTTTNNTDVPTSGLIRLGDFYDAVKLIFVTISSDIKEANIADLATAAGWDGNGPVNVTINSGVYCWSDDTSAGGLIVPASMTAAVRIFNSGYIIGRGGNGGAGVGQAGFSGGPGVQLFNSTTSITNNSGAFIAGGGGGGGGGLSSSDGSSGGGGGAGGGIGGSSNGGGGGGAGGAVGAAGGNSPGNENNTGGVGGQCGGSGGGRNQNDGKDSVSGGGGGGRVLLGSGANARIPTGSGADNPGGYGGASGQGGGRNGYPYANATGTIGDDGPYQSAGAGGGGWANAGGTSSGGGSRGGGAGGLSITGGPQFVTNNGTLFGAVG